MTKQVRLVYFSRASRPMSMEDIQNILGVARSNNDALGVCGMLAYEQEWFLQALEGPRSVVNELYLDIADDARHDEVEILAYDEIDAPEFGQWQMGFAPASDSFYQLLNEIGVSRFDPREFSTGQALALLRQLAAQ